MSVKCTSFKMKFCRNSYFITFWSVVSTLSYLIESTNLTELNGNLPEPQVLSRILNEFVMPIIQSVSLDNTFYRSNKETAVEKAVKAKIVELQKYLQDNDVNIFDEDNYILGGDDETTIIEFLPKTKIVNETKLRSFKYNLSEYKKITRKIEKALKKESVSETTKSLILKTLDGLFQQLIEGQCNWKRTRVDKTGGPYGIVNKWRSGWQDIKNTITKFLASDPRRNSNIPQYIDSLHRILRKVTRDANLISKKYKIQCEFVPKVSYLRSTENPNNLVYNWDRTETEADRCRNIFVCSDELRAFVLNFYKNLNDTAVSVVRNYADMYDKEVHSNVAEENKYIVSQLHNISNDLQGYISEIFIKETIKFKLDKDKNPDANIKFISDFIKSNINNVKEKVRKTLRTQLANIREKIMIAIRDDIQVNLVVDLGNLELEFLKRICTVFRLCTGRYSGRRQTSLSDSVHKNNVNLELQLSFDDELPKHRRVQGLPLSETTKLNKYVSDVTVTRTTLMSTST